MPLYIYIDARVCAAATSPMPRTLTHTWMQAMLRDGLLYQKRLFGYIYICIAVQQSKILYVPTEVVFRHQKAIRMKFGLVFGC